jgi:hypothetical protein
LPYIKNVETNILDRYYSYAARTGGGCPQAFEITMEKNTLLSLTYGGKRYVVPPPPHFPY